MAVWTIAAQEGTRGGTVAASLAAAAGVPLLDRKALALLAHDPEPVAEEVGELEERIGGRLDMLALSIICGTTRHFCPAEGAEDELPGTRKPAASRETCRAPAHLLT
jgi:hypothetical protein